MNNYVVKQYMSLADAMNAMIAGVHTLAIDLDDFERIYELDVRAYTDLLGLSNRHTLVFVGIIKKEEYYDRL